MVVMLQEICSYDPEARVTHIQGKARGPEVAELALQAVPSCAVRAARGALGTLGQVSAAPYVEVTLKARAARGPRRGARGSDAPGSGGRCLHWQATGACRPGGG